MTVNRMLIIAFALVLAGLIWALRSGAAADQREKIARAQVDSILKIRQKDETAAREDSVALVRANEAFASKELQFMKDRARLRNDAMRASSIADSARTALAIVLDSAGVSHDLLDAMQGAHDDEVAAKDAEIERTDSILAGREMLLRATEQALESERAVHRDLLDENFALRSQVLALHSGRKRERAGEAIVLTGVLAALIMR